MLAINEKVCLSRTSFSTFRGSPLHEGLSTSGSDSLIHYMKLLWFFTSGTFKTVSVESGETVNKLNSKLNDSGRKNWFTRDCKILLSNSLSIFPPKTDYPIRVRRASHGILLGSTFVRSFPIVSSHSSTQSIAQRWSLSLNSYIFDQPIGVYRSLSYTTALNQDTKKCNLALSMGGLSLLC